MKKKNEDKIESGHVRPIFSRFRVTMSAPNLLDCPLALVSMTDRQLLVTDSLCKLHSKTPVFLVKFLKETKILAPISAIREQENVKTDSHIPVRVCSSVLRFLAIP